MGRCKNTGNKPKIKPFGKPFIFTYEPSRPPRLGFWKRLEKWLNNIAPDESTEKVLFNSIPELFFVGPKEFDVLYSLAYNRHIAQWLIEESKLMLDVDKIVEILHQLVKETWFCPISDSMRINSFYHVNQIPASFDYRPDWRSMHKFADEQRVRDYCSKEQIKRIVLLEDFVGSGSQMEKAVRFAAKLSDIVSILVVPLIICPDGIDCLRSIRRDFDINFSPVLSLEVGSFVSKTKSPNEKPIITDIRKLVSEKYPLVIGKKHPGYGKPYGPFGYQDTGGLIVMFTNTPDNSLPIIHWKSDTWEPLFPRHSRL